MVMLPILTGVKAGQIVELRDVLWSEILVERWSASANGDEPGWLLIELGDEQEGVVQRLACPEGVPINVRIKAIAEGWLFGNEEIVKLTTKNGSAGGNLTFYRAEDESADLSKHTTVGEDRSPVRNDVLEDDPPVRAKMAAAKDPQTGLQLPAEIGGWRVHGDMRVHGGRGGTSLSYEHDRGFQASVFVYPGSILLHLDGVTQQVYDHFEAVCQDLRSHWEIVQPFETTTRVYEVRERDVQWLCGRCVLVMNDVRQTSWVYLTAWRGHFVKVRHTYPVALGNTAEPAAVPLLNGLSARMLENDS